MSDSIYDMFATDQDAETKGKWLTYGKVRFLVARAGGANDSFSKAMTKVMRPHARRFKMNLMEPKEVNVLALEPFVDACLLNWENVRLKPTPAQVAAKQDGDVLPYTRDNAIKLLTDIPELYTQLMEDAQAIGTFAPEDVEDIAKNL